MSPISQKSISPGQSSYSEQELHATLQPTIIFQRQALKRTLQQCNPIDCYSSDDDNDSKKSRNITNISYSISQSPSSGLGPSHRSLVIDGTDNGSSQDKESITDECTKLLNVIRRGKLSTENIICRVLKLLKECSDKSFIGYIRGELGNDIIEDMSEGKFNSLHAINVANDIADFVKEDWSYNNFYMACHKFFDPSSALRIITMFTGITTIQHNTITQSEECSDASITHLDPIQDTGTTLQDVLDVIEADNKKTCNQSTSISVNSINISEYCPEQVRSFIINSNIELSNMMKSIINCQVTHNQLVYYRLKLTKEKVSSEIINAAMSYVRARVYKFQESERSNILAAMRDSAKIARFVKSNSKSNRKLRDTCYTLLEHSFADTVLRMLSEDMSTQNCQVMGLVAQSKDVDTNEPVDEEEIDINELVDEEDLDINELVDEENIDHIEESIKQDLFNAMFGDTYSPPDLLKSENSEEILEAVRQTLILPHDFIYTRKKLLDLGVSKRDIRNAFMLCKKRITSSVCCDKILQQYLYAFSSLGKVAKHMPRFRINNKAFWLFTRILLGELSSKLVNELQVCLEKDIGYRRSRRIIGQLAYTLNRENKDRRSEVLSAFGYV